MNWKWLFSRVWLIGFPVLQDEATFPLLWRLLDRRNISVFYYITTAPFSIRWGLRWRKNVAHKELLLVMSQRAPISCIRFCCLSNVISRLLVDWSIIITMNREAISRTQEKMLNAIYEIYDDLQVCYSIKRWVESGGFSPQLNWNSQLLPIQ